MDPLVSVVIPTYNRPKELRLCLDGFTHQIVPIDQFEVIVSDDGSEADIGSVADSFDSSLNLRYIRSSHRGAGAARNTAIEHAIAPLLILYDDDLRPLPDLVHYCLEFHASHPAEEDSILLEFGPDEAIAGSPILNWAFRRLYPFPNKPEISGFIKFWSGTLSCKKSIFRYGLFNRNYHMLEDTELGLRLSQSIDIRVHYEPRLTGTLTRGFSFPQICSRQYAIGYFSQVFARDFKLAESFRWPPYDSPEKYVMQDEGQLAALVATTRGLESSATCPASKMLQALWTRADSHVRAEGWIAARDGMPFTPPGSIGRYL